MILLSSFFRQDREYGSLLSTLKEQMRAPTALPIVVNGLTSGASDAFLSAILTDVHARRSAPVLILAPNENEASRYTRLLCAQGIDACHYKSRDFVFHNITASHDTERERLSVLHRLCCAPPVAVVATPSAAMSITMPKAYLSSVCVDVSLGTVMEPVELCARLQALGYARVDMVESAGQYASRGGIVDVYPEASDSPVRMEFFGDEIDRIEAFDPITQRVIAPAHGLSLLPAEEVLPDVEGKERLLQVIGHLIDRAEDAERRARLEREKNAISEGLSAPFKDKYLGIIYPEHTCLFDYLGERPVVFVSGTAQVREELTRREEMIKNDILSLVGMGMATKEGGVCIKGASAYDAYLEGATVVHVNPFSGGVGTLRTSGLFGFRTRRTVSYGDNPRMLLEDVGTLRRGGYRILILVERPEGIRSLIETFTEVDMPAIEVDGETLTPEKMTPGTVYVAVGAVDEGYELITPRIAVLSTVRDSMRAVLDNKRRARAIRRAGGAGARLMSYADLSVGDYVVHRHYGIGLFEGIEAVRIDGVTRDYITIRYQGTDKLFVPCDRLEMIGKYIGQKDKDGTVKLSRMGGGDWNKTKSRAKGAVKDIAKQLIALYAERQRRPGYAFSPESEMEREFAAGFGYEETPSQKVAIEEIFSDMQRPVPMNRLLCGDVGFGKTEVALRAAFKAIVNNKQVALLVPTTILALQHYQTALSRMRGFPVTVEMLSRFRTPKEQESILRRVKRGEVDLLIGTHKLLSKELAFRDLGLLIVDEEQRFGVSQKEKLKEMARNVDVLTLSATPIPRTLHMALGGINDMSVLDEAPGDRRPVQTYVLEHDDGVIYDAIRRELDREGQVLYLYNKVEDIDLVAGRLQRDFPDARVTYAHGQMEREELEEIWQMLVRGELDILVCTTIIETGVDLPQANTLVIEMADRMGLSQLHQIRGRVGRSPRQAYAYFTFRPGKAISEIAAKRLTAIREFAEFGAGFQIALRDLEIRGAGNLLGAQQHGHIESVGYDLYVKLLSEAVLEEQGRTLPPRVECTVDIKVDAHIPTSYITVDAQRMEMYKKISLITTSEDGEDILDEMIDRYGTPPRAVERLVTVATVRSMAEHIGITRVGVRTGYLVFTLGSSDLSVWAEVMEEHGALLLRAGQTPTVSARIGAREDALDLALSVLRIYERADAKMKERENSDAKAE